jgi:hypothetical protein
VVLAIAPAVTVDGAAGSRIAAAAAHPTAGVQRPDLSTSALVKSGVDYVSGYQEQFAFLLADEVTTQRVFSGTGAEGPPAASRTTRGEVFITFLDGRRHWTIVRDVAEVDGLPVADRVDLAAIIGREDTDALARRLFALNARYNIGRVLRNFNDPMLALLALNGTHRPRFAFDAARVDRRDPGTPLVRLAFRERERPTLVRSTSGASVYARGTITLDPATGIVHQTDVMFEADGIAAELTTEFEREERLGLWVPSRFIERYTSARDRREVTTAASRYTNYRRFEVTSRVRPGVPVE